MDNAIKIKINYEISQIDELLEKSQVLLALVKNKEPDFIEITAIGGILHSFYFTVILMAIQLNGKNVRTYFWDSQIFGSL